MFNKLKEKLSGFKESITNKILEKAAGSVPILGNKAETATVKQEQPTTAIKETVENKAINRSAVLQVEAPKISIIDKAKSLILERRSF